MSRSNFCHSCPGLVEDGSKYCLGGFHPIAIGDCFAQGRYRVIHKLGFGGSSTVWLARDQDHHHDGILVALKALRADQSTSSNYELAIQEILQAADPPVLNIQTVYDHFYVDGPNGTHLFLVYPLAGPSITMCCTSGRIDGTKRLREDLAHKVIKQLVGAVGALHRAGVMHGDITCHNILFPLRREVHKWTDAEIYDVLGKIDTIEVEAYDGTPLQAIPPGVPAMFTLPAKYRRLIDESATFLEESIILADFGQSLPIDSAIYGYKPGTLINYFAPETRFEERVGFEADVWQLGCAIFEIRAGGPLFDPMIGISKLILKETVAILGPLPDPWRRQLEKGDANDGKPRLGLEDSEKETSIRGILTSIGDKDLKPRRAIGPMFETTGVKITEQEVELLQDLLEKMLRYIPEERITLPEVMRHPYLTMCK